MTADGAVLIIDWWAGTAAAALFNGATDNLPEGSADPITGAAATRHLTTKRRQTRR
ncbi:hypothetical protein APR12_005102 [Nocardia amikacinitolerans]|nr:hypothetical protein [Nocardia amikacinitolerans]